MKRSTIALLALLLALAVPTAAGAKNHPKHSRQTPRPTATTRNAATMCKALRAANPALFAQAFGTNHNKRNAYGKCVSGKARARHQGRTVTFGNVVLRSTGTVTSAGQANCQFTTAGCTLQSTGVVTGALTGTYASTFTILYQSPSTHSNGSGGFCAPASGSVVLTFPGLGTLTKQETGEVCEVGATGTNVPHTFQGTFSVSSGTGVFAGATGNGTTTFAQQPGATTSQGGAVTGSETFTTLTVAL